MKRTLIIISAAAILAGGCFAQGKGQGKGKGKDKAVAAEHNDGRGGRGRGGIDVNIRFGDTYGGWVRDYYRPRLGNLPPGLEKQLMRNGTLPPGLRKKLQPFPAELEGRLPPLPVGYGRRVVGTRAVIMHLATNTVVDVINLMAR